MKKLIAGNWKMNGLLAEVNGLAGELVRRVKASDAACDVLLCPPFPLIDRVVQTAQGSAVHVGAQDCHAAEKGAYTGDVSTALLKDIGASHVILGHSERRAETGHAETDAQVCEKAIAAHNAGLVTVICVGETEAEREADKAFDVVQAQLAASVPDCATAENTVIAYEPVWAIGTGKTATVDDIASMHAFIRDQLKARNDGWAACRILYGGSVKPANAQDILHTPNVDGALVGGASLKADDFWAIITAAAGVDQQAAVSA